MCFIAANWGRRIPKVALLMSLRVMALLNSAWAVYGIGVGKVEGDFMVSYEVGIRILKSAAGGFVLFASILIVLVDFRL